MVAVYLRVSTHQQNATAQRAEIKKWLKGHGHKPSKVKWFEDKESGKTLIRPGFDKLQKAIFNGEVKTVVVWKLDRLSRSQRDGINLLAELCDRGVRVVSVTQQLDLSGATGRLVAGVLFGIAEMELENIRERQAAGIAQAKKGGVYRGRKSGTLKANPKRANVMRSRGLKIHEIASAMEVSTATVKRYLTKS
jgi:DNA invertase Pin-like site-specific DNA recombinase